MIYLSHEIQDRSEFTQLLNTRGLTTGYAVEVGTMKAEFSELILRGWTGCLHCIDPYVATWEAPGDRTEHERIARERLNQFGIGVRVWMHREFNCEALADRIVSRWGQPVFVYIDGDHKYKPCKSDISIWWQRLRDGGVLAGHDYTLRLPGVVRAVNEFADEISETVFVTHESDWKSWYTTKGSVMRGGSGYVLPIQRELLLDAAQG